jgi:4-amino-4-deoxy-L-arabinose transferase-like glycosyltransferase
VTDQAQPIAKPLSPAIVTQAAVKRLPRWALLLLCVAYVLPGFVGREPWKSVDMASFGLMRELALGNTPWFQPSLLGMGSEMTALLPYWLGAWAIKLAPAWIPMDFAARIPFGLLLGLTMAATWYGVYYLARRPFAQPVPFAFGGEAKPTGYARSVADGALLALIAMLGLAQMAHETTYSLVQLACSALLLYGFAACAYRPLLPLAALALSIFGLALSGSASLGLALCIAAVALLLVHTPDAIQQDPKARSRTHLRWVAGGAVALASAAYALAVAMQLVATGYATELTKAFEFATRNAQDWRLLVWFAWPAWPLAIVALLRWRKHWRSLHIALPVVLAGVATFASLLVPAQDRALLLALPALAALAAFALPTMHRNVSAIIDWFTLLFFTGCALVIWVVWVSMQTGFPPQPALNVQRLAPGFAPQFSWLIVGLALLASGTWLWLVRWRVSRHRHEMWKSLVLPAGGAALCWFLLMTLWLPLLDFARSYAPLVRTVALRIGPQPCVHAYGLTRGQAAAFAYHGQMKLKATDASERCPWLVVDADAVLSLPSAIKVSDWTLHGTIRRPSDDNEDVLIFQRNTP